MPLTRDFHDTVVERAKRDPEYRAEMLKAAMRCLIDLEPEIAKHHLRNYINATMGLDALAEATGKSKPNLSRMLGKEGSPSINNYFLILNVALKHEGIGGVVVDFVPKKRRTEPPRRDAVGGSKIYKKVAAAKKAGAAAKKTIHRGKKTPRGATKGKVA